MESSVTSSGVLEVPTFKKQTINIGNRQKGRTQAKSIINCKPTKEGISTALKELMENRDNSSQIDYTNPYGDGTASEKIINKLEEISSTRENTKSFFDIPYFQAK